MLFLSSNLGLPAHSVQRGLTLLQPQPQPQPQAQGRSHQSFLRPLSLSGLLELSLLAAFHHSRIFPGQEPFTLLPVPPCSTEANTTVSFFCGKSPASLASAAQLSGT